MSELLESYLIELDNSDYDVGDLMAGLRSLNREYGEKMQKAEDERGLKILQLEHELLHIVKSVEDGLKPTMSGTNTNEEGKEVLTIWPDFHSYDDGTLEYFNTRYNATKNLFLKTEYGLLLYAKNKLNRNDEKKQLAEEITELSGSYWIKIEAGSDKSARYRHHFYNRLMDVFLILLRAGASLEGELQQLIKELEQKFLTCPAESNVFYSLADFLVNSFTVHRKKVNQYINAEQILSHMESGAQHFLNSDPYFGTLLSKLVLKFSKAYNLTTSESFEMLIGRAFESLAVQEIEKENWLGGVKYFEDALQYYTLAKNQSQMELIKSYIDEHKGKFKMGVFTSETTEEQNEQIQEVIQKIVESDNKEKILYSIGGFGILSGYKTIHSEAVKRLKEPSFMNHMSLQSFDKYGNVVRVYESDDDRILHYLFEGMHVSCQMGFQITAEILKRSLRKNKLTYNDIESYLKLSWLNEEITLQTSGDMIKVIPLETILPGVKIFIDELTRAVTTKGYKPNFVLAIDSMSLKIEYVLRNICFKLGISTFKYRHANDVMTAEEKPLSGLLTALEGKLDIDDIWFIRFLLNEKGGYNFRNRIAHGLVDSDEYGFYPALVSFTLLLRLSSYQFGISARKTNNSNEE